MEPAKRLLLPDSAYTRKAEKTITIAAMCYGPGSLDTVQHYECSPTGVRSDKRVVTNWACELISHLVVPHVSNYTLLGVGIGLDGSRTPRPQFVQCVRAYER